MYSCHVDPAYAEDVVSVCTKKSTDGSEYHYIDFGSEYHGRTSFRLWVSHRLLKRNEEGHLWLEFPVRGTILSTAKGNVVLKPSHGTLVHHIYIPCGYRGGAKATFEPKPIIVLEYAVYRSPRGNLGVSAGYLVEIPADQSLTVRWERWGRLYGAPSSGIFVVHPDGRVDAGDHIDDPELRGAL